MHIIRIYIKRYISTGCGLYYVCIKKTNNNSGKKGFLLRYFLIKIFSFFLWTIFEYNINHEIHTNFYWPQLTIFFVAFSITVVLDHRVKSS